MKADVKEEARELIEKYRDRCLWFLRPDFTPRSREEIFRVLDLIERYGDREGFERARRLREWLLLPRPDAVALGKRWHAILKGAKDVCSRLPADKVGTCVIGAGRELYRGSAAELAQDLGTQIVAFHQGRIGGSWPVFVG